MKKLISFIFSIVVAAVAMAQTPEEIVSRMEAEMDKHDNSEGLAITIDLKIPIVGSMSTRSYTLGDKIRMEATNKGNKIITWIDGDTEWDYNAEKNEVEIKKKEIKDSEKSKEDDDDTKLFKGVTDGYDVTLDKETDTEWHFLCKRSRKNKDKDAPKKMELVIKKGTYMPVSLSTRLSGVSMTLRDIEFGVTDEQVTFNPEEFPTATIIDKR